MRWSGGPAESFTWTIGKRPGQRAKYASGSCPPLVIQYRSTSSWTSWGSVSASSTSYGNFPSSGANSKSWLWYANCSPEAKAAGLQFAYHNHDFEFAPLEGKLPYDVLLAETDPKLVQLEVDLYWITKGGQDPLAYFARWPGRFPMVHVKDSAGPPDHRIVEVGAGKIDFKKIFAQSDQAGIKHYFVEHDEPADAFASIRASCEYLKRLEF